MLRLVLLVFFIANFFTPSFSQIPGFKGQSGYFKMPSTISETDYVSKKVVFKLNYSGKSLLNGDNINHYDFQKLLITINGHCVPKLSLSQNQQYSNSNPYESQENPLMYLFELDYVDSYTVEQVINQLYSFGIVEYAEPLYIPKLLYSPNDPKATNQYYLDAVKAYQAWDISKGDTNIVIGIVDTGVELIHADLANNIKHNYNDPIDGIDNDNDGYKDNFTGWDLGENDNDPTPTAAGHHGTWVSGCAVAVPDNANGGAGLGYNTKIMPIKITNAAGYLTSAYDGIIYAADHGCKIINASWGSEGAFSQYCQDIINYAFGKGCVIVAAAGNSNNSGLFYPASYDHVLSVTGTDQTDQKWIFNTANGSNYNSLVDICAPAKAIYTTYQGGGFINIGGGTSFSSPQVAAAAALVWQKFPSYSAEQVMCQLKATTDDIYTIPFNTTYKGLLGTGRLNAYKALTNNSSPYLLPVNTKVSNGLLSKGDTISIWVDLKNYLAATSGSVTATISSTNTNVNIISNSSTYGTVANLQTKSGSIPFKFVVGANASLNELVIFQMKITDGTYTCNENVSVRVNKDYIDILVNDVYTSVTNYGKIGYNASFYGQGVNHKKTSSLIFDMGLMIGIDSSKVSSARDLDFYNDGKLKIQTPGESNFDVVGNFSDAAALTNAIKINVSQKSMAWNSAGNTKYVILEYCVKNMNTTDIKNAYVGIYTDYDIIDGKKNKADFIVGKKLGYAYKDGGLYGGVQLLSNENVSYYAFNNDGSGGSIKLSDGFSSAEQYQALSSGLIRTAATEGDISSVISAGPLTIAKGDSVYVAFAVITGDNLADITTSATNASAKYKEIRSVKVGLVNYADVTCNGANDGKIAVSLSSGKKPYSVSWSGLTGVTDTAVNNLAPGNYTLKVTDKFKFETNQTYTINEPTKLKVNKGLVTHVKCNGDKTGEVALVVTGGTPTYYYNWNNPLITSVAAPGLPAGTHYLTVSDARGCAHKDTITIIQPEKMTIQSTYLNDSTNTCNGNVSVSVTGGSTPYSYLWNDASAQTTNTAQKLCAGSYTVVISDKNKCSSTRQFEIAGKSTSQNNITEHSPQHYNMSVFPNPVSGYFFIEFELPENAAVDLSLYDAAGNRVKNVITGNYNQGAYKILVYTDDISAGFYFYRLKVNDSAASGKVNIQN